MATTYDFHTSSELGAARELVRLTLQNQGYEVRDSPTGGFLAVRGSMGMTLAFGALAGGRMHMSFDVQFLQNGTQIVVRVSRDLAKGALKGGAIGASRTAEAFQDLSHHVGTALHEAGVLLQTTEA